MGRRIGQLRRSAVSLGVGCDMVGLIFEWAPVLPALGAKVANIGRKYPSLGHRGELDSGCLSLRERDVRATRRPNPATIEGVTTLSRDFQDLLALFASHRVRFIVVGGYAVAAHGHPRYTKDLDIWVEPDPANADRVVAALREFGFGSLGLTQDDFTQTDVVIQLGREPGRVDLLTSISGVEFAECYPKRVPAMFGTTEVPVLDRSSLIANKRSSGRPQDLADADKLSKG